MKILTIILCLSITCFANNVFAVAGNPFSGVEQGLSDLQRSITTIIQILLTIALILYAVVSVKQGRFDQVRLTIIGVGIIIVSLAKAIVEYISSWVS